jgi:glycosyltransferase involved in cell wall biosynthesis
MTDKRDATAFAALDVEICSVPAVSSLVNRTWDTARCHVLAVDDAVLFPDHAMESAVGLVESDLRIATVSFFSNYAGFLSFPFRDSPAEHLGGDLDQETVTARLRDRAPASRPVPIMYATGKAVLFSYFPHTAVGALSETPSGTLELAAAEYSLRARRRGFRDILDASTFFLRPADIAQFDNDPWLDQPEREWLVARHPFFLHLLDVERARQDSPLGIAHSAARTKVQGLRVLIDGTCIGPQEMGTQVQTLCLISALADQPDVASIGVALAGPVPRYAEAVLAKPKIRAAVCPPDDYRDLGEFDVAHRPFQPDRPIDVAGWRRSAGRLVFSLQDLIAYHVAQYHRDHHHWLVYRNVLAEAIAKADGVVVISDDVARIVGEECLPVESGRLFVVPNGTDHLRGDEAEATPRALLDRSFAAGDFLVVLGANYAHKNRDLAVDAWLELRNRRFDLSLVLVGAAVPYGSSRIDEVEVSRSSSGGLYVVADVTGPERNWLLRHAAVALYPTAAEGFGLVPYEAACFGTPTVLVPFGPLGEFVPDSQSASPDWSPRSLADAVERLLTDPAAAKSQVEATLATGSGLTWNRTAERLVYAYRAVLSSPPR